MNRKDYLGGSDIAAVMGMSRYKTPLQLWAEKTGQLEPKDLSNNEAVELGSELEDFVAKKFHKKTGLAIRKAPKIYKHPKYDFIRCQVDRLITGTNDLLEVKTTSAWKSKDWEAEEIPTEYILQVMWQLGITGRKTGFIAVLIGGQSFRWKQIEFDADLFDKMLCEAIKFWALVESKVPPMACGDDKETLLALYPKEMNEEMLQNYQEMENDIARRQELIMHIDQMKEEKEAIDNKLRQVIGDNLGIVTEKYIVKNKKQKVTPRVNFEKMKGDDVYGQYVEENFVRVLKVTLNKGEKNG